MNRPLSEQVVVITGASSGIGLETAKLMARQGATIAMIARGQEPLSAAVAEVEAAGGKALPMVVDVGRWEEVQEAADHVMSHFGRIDTWVNNAGVYQVAPVEAMSVEEIAQVIQINLMGMIHGTKAVLPHLIELGGGTIISVSSVLGVRGAPNLAAYAASKHGIKGFVESLRLEMARSHPEINIGLILPLGINTPLFDHTLARVGVKPRPNPPVYEPNAVAEVIAEMAVSPKRDVYIGPGRFFAWAEALMPAVVDRAMLTGDMMVKLMSTDEPDTATNNLFGSADPSTYGPTGTLGNESQQVSRTTRYFELRPNLWRAGIGAAAGGAVLALRGRGKDKHEANGHLNGHNGHGTHADGGAEAD